MRRRLLTVLLLVATLDGAADTRVTPAARAEIERFDGPYPSDQIMALRAIYKEHLRSAGFEAAIATRNVEYGPNDRHRLDLLQPRRSAEAPRPIVVFIHGGAFVRGQRSDGEIFDNVLNYFTRHGMLGVNATYRLAPQHKWPAAAEDMRDLVTWVRENAADYGGDPTKIFLMGHSAGAVHVASYVFMEDLHPPGEDDGVRGAILLSGVYGDETGKSEEHAYFGAADKVGERVPLAFVEGRRVPLFIVDAEYDPLRMQRSALELMSAVCERDGRCPRHQQIPGHNHYSMTYHINTLDDSIARDVLDFVRDLSRD